MVKDELRHTVTITRKEYRTTTNGETVTAYDTEDWYGVCDSCKGVSFGYNHLGTIKFAAQKYHKGNLTIVVVDQLAEKEG